jgi:hypothetical protein
MIIVVFYEDTIFGTFNSTIECYISIKPLIEKKFIDESKLNFKIYNTNSLNLVKNLNYEDYLNYIEIEKPKKEKNMTEEEKEEYKTKMLKIDALNEEKEKINRKKSEYEEDEKLYKQFKKILESNENFEIPPLFVEKFEIFKQLEENDEISFDNFFKYYKYKNVSLKNPLLNSIFN